MKWSDIPDWVFICVGILCLFWSGYAAWQDKNKALIALQEKLKAPEFGGELGMVATGSNITGRNIVVVSGVVTNPLGPPSGIINWTMTIKFSNGMAIKGEIPLVSGKDISIPLEGTKESIILPAKNYWPENSTQPIPAGGVLIGWLWSSFSNLDLEEAYEKKAVVVVEFKDAVAQKEHKLTIPLVIYCRQIETEISQNR